MMILCVLPTLVGTLCQFVDAYETGRPSLTFQDQFACLVARVQDTVSHHQRCKIAYHCKANL